MITIDKKRKIDTTLFQSYSMLFKSFGLLDLAEPRFSSDPFSDERVLHCRRSSSSATTWLSSSRNCFVFGSMELDVVSLLPMISIVLFHCVCITSCSRSAISFLFDQIKMIEKHWPRSSSTSRLPLFLIDAYVAIKLGDQFRRASQL